MSGNARLVGKSPVVEASAPAETSPPSTSQPAGLASAVGNAAMQDLVTPQAAFGGARFDERDDKMFFRVGGEYMDFDVRFDKMSEGVPPGRTLESADQDMPLESFKDNPALRGFLAPVGSAGEATSASSKGVVQPK